MDSIKYLGEWIVEVQALVGLTEDLAQAGPSPVDPRFCFVEPHYFAWDDDDDPGGVLAGPSCATGGVEELAGQRTHHLGWADEDFLAYRVRLQVRGEPGDHLEDPTVAVLRRLSRSDA